MLENSGSDRARFVTTASCAVRLAIHYVSLKTRPQRNDICSALIKIDKGYDVRNNILKLDFLSPEPKRKISVGFPEVQNEPANSLFTFDSLRNLTRQYVSKEEDANRLCGLLRAAEEAVARGDLRPRPNFSPHTFMRYPRRLIS